MQLIVIEYHHQIRSVSKQAFLLYNNSLLLKQTQQGESVKSAMETKRRVIVSAQGVRHLYTRNVVLMVYAMPAITTLMSTPVTLVMMTTQ